MSSYSGQPLKEGGPELDDGNKKDEDKDASDDDGEDVNSGDEKTESQKWRELVKFLQQVGLPRWLSGRGPTCQCRRHEFHLWVGKNPGRRKWQPAPLFLPGETHRQRRLAGYSLQSRKKVGHDLVTKGQEQQWYSR